MTKKTNIPVIMYHTIGCPNKKWRYNHLTCPYELFESQLKWMKKKNFHTISLQQLYDYMNEGICIPKNPVVITFDDGYLDNWIFAYPLLKKYGFNGTTYVTPEFVDPRHTCRKTLEDVWNKKTEIKNLENKGFLSWQEMKEMIKAGVMDIQSHTMTHTCFFKSNKIIDFRHPGDSYVWMTRNNNLDKKPYLQIENDRLINYGEPVYEYGKALEIKRFFPDEKLSNYIITYVKEHGVKNFFKNADWKDRLFEISESYRKKNQLVEKFETEEENFKRIMYELKNSKEIIEKKLKNEVKFLCWPGGGTSQKAIKIASEVGYISSTVAKDIKNNIRKEIKNTYGENPSRINRMGSTLYWNGIAGYNNKVKYKNGLLMVLSLYHFQERKIIAQASKIILVGMGEYYKLRYSLKR